LSGSARTLSLTCHPQGGRNPVRRIDVHLDLAADGKLVIRYVLDADLDAVRIPQPRPPRHTDLLWHHTCFELFIRAIGSPLYIEYNFSPSGEWATYAFVGYKEAVPLPKDGPAPSLRMLKTPTALELEAVVYPQQINPELAGADLSFAISAIIEDRDGALSYWALAHPLSQPDFHHAQSFVLTLPRV
jgi:hypothetical protein